MSTIHVEDWQGTYGSPYMVLPDDPGVADVSLVEDGLRVRRPGSQIMRGRHRSLAFVDGVRRIEMPAPGGKVVVMAVVTAPDGVRVELIGPPE